MVFLGIYRAIYEYDPQSEGELALSEGDLLLVLEKSTEDDWWTVKKKAAGGDDDEPEGLVPSTYIEEVCYSFSVGGTVQPCLLPHDRCLWLNI